MFTPMRCHELLMRFYNVFLKISLQSDGLGNRTISWKDAVACERHLVVVMHHNTNASPTYINYTAVSWYYI